MKFISSRDIKTNPSILWKDLDKESMIITVNGKPKGIVIEAVEPIDLLLSIIRQVKAQTAVEKLRISALENGLDHLTDQEIQYEIKEARNQK